MTLLDFVWITLGVSLAVAAIVVALVAFGKIQITILPEEKEDDR